MIFSVVSIINLAVRIGPALSKRGCSLILRFEKESVCIRNDVHHVNEILFITIGLSNENDILLEKFVSESATEAENLKLKSEIHTIRKYFGASLYTNDGMYDSHLPIYFVIIELRFTYGVFVFFAYSSLQL